MGFRYLGNFDRATEVGRQGDMIPLLTVIRSSPSSRPLEGQGDTGIYTHLPIQDGHPINLQVSRARPICIVSTFYAYYNV